MRDPGGSWPGWCWGGIKWYFLVLFLLLGSLLLFGTFWYSLFLFSSLLLFGTPFYLLVLCYFLVVFGTFLGCVFLFSLWYFLVSLVLLVTVCLPVLKGQICIVGHGEAPGGSWMVGWKEEGLGE